LQDQRGSIFAIMGIGLVMAAGFTALAVDISYLYVLKGKLQTTADFAVLAAVTQLPDEDAARTMALEYTAKNMPAAEHGTVLANADVVTGNWDADTRTFTPAGDPVNAVRVVTRRSQANGNAAGLFFARVLGFNEVDMETSAVAAFGSNKAWDVVIVQDVTTSFSAEMGDAVAAGQTLLECIRDYTSPDSQVGITLFTGVSLIAEQLQPIGTNFDDLYQTVSDFATAGGTGTHVGAGLESGNAQFTDPGYTPAPDALGKAMIIVGDGKSTVDSDVQPYDGSCGGNCDVFDLERIAVEQADAADAMGISVYTVFYDENDDDSTAAFFEDLVRGDGLALRTPDAQDLPEMLFQICASLPLKLVK
jgi:hypothetical protein